MKKKTKIKNKNRNEIKEKFILLYLIYLFKLEN